MQDWSRAQAYAYTQALSGREWAWEFLRRNPQFKAAWQRSALQRAIEDRPSTMNLAIDPSLSAWGIIFRRPSRNPRAPCSRPVGPRRVLDRVSRER
jgi:hypothetical protein